MAHDFQISRDNPALFITALPQKSISVVTSFVFSSCDARGSFLLCRKLRTIHEVTRTNTNKTLVAYVFMIRSDSSFNQSAQNPFSARDGKEEPFLTSGGEAEMPGALKARTSVHSPDLFCRHFPISALSNAELFENSDPVRVLPTLVPRPMKFDG